MSSVINLTRFARVHGRIPRDVWTLVILRAIPTERIGNGFYLTSENPELLKQAFAELDQEAARRGMKIRARAVA